MPYAAGRFIFGSCLINGTADHIHILSLLSRRFSIMDVVKKSKTETSKWLKRKSPEIKDFRWQAGYGIFSVSESRLKPAKLYITNQEEHHKRISFQEEFKELCRLHGLPIDERYVWD